MDVQKKKIVYKALAYTFVIMFLALLLANVIYDWKKSELNSGLIEISNQSEETKLFLNFYETFHRDSNSCELMEEYFRGFSSRVFDLGRLVQGYVEDNKDVDEVKVLQKDFIFMDIQLWLKMVEYNEVCDLNRNYILYFYPYNCEECAPLATKIMALKKERKNLWVFSIPGQIDVQMVNFLQRYFKADYLPSVVVNGVTLKGPDVGNQIEQYLK